MASVRGLRLLPRVGVIVTVILVFTLCNTRFRAAAPQSYGVTDLGTLGGSMTFAYDVNDAGQVVGYSTTSFNTHAFLWQNGQMTDLGTLDLGTHSGNFSAAYAVNGLGTAVGNSPVSNGNPRATMWRDGRIIDLTPDVAVYESSWASSINDAGRWTGSVQLEELPPWHGFVAEGFTRTPIGHLGGGSSFPNDINNAGQVVGSSYTKIVDGVEQGAHAFLWENGVLTDLGVLPDDTESTALAINSFAVIVGSSSRTNTTTFQETRRPFIRANGSMTVIPVPSVDAQAADINDSGVVVGTMKASGGLSTDHAWVYQDGVVTNLNSLVVARLGASHHIRLRDQQRRSNRRGRDRRARVQPRGPAYARGVERAASARDPDHVDQRRDERRRKIRDQELHVHGEPVEGDDYGREREFRDGEWLRDRSGGLQGGVRHARVQRWRDGEDHRRRGHRRSQARTG